MRPAGPLLSRSLSLATTALVVGCSGPTFSVSAGGRDAATDQAAGGPDGASTDAKGHKDAGRDVGVGDASPPRDATQGDASSRDATTGDAARSDASPGCGPLTPSSIYVSVGGPTNGNGSMGCPFRTIHQGVAAAASAVGAGTTSVSQVEVSGGSYAEVDLVIPSGVVVQGTAGAATTFLQGTSSANCPGSVSPCAVVVDRGATLDGFTVGVSPSPSRDGSVTGDGVVGAPSATDTLAPPLVKNVVVAGLTGGYGIVALGSMAVGPNVSSSGNSTGASRGAGLWVSSNGTVTVVGTATQPNHFDNNTGNGVVATGSAGVTFSYGTTSGNHLNGLDMTAGGTLNYTSGTANNNGVNGVRLGGTATGTHKITSLTATGNQASGVAVYDTDGVQQRLTLRNSTLLGNKAAGLYYDYGLSVGSGTASPLDIGEATTAGGDVFGRGSGDGGVANNAVGVYLCHAPPLQLAYGDTFSICQPRFLSSLLVLGDGGVTSCPSLPPTYFDVVAATATTPGSDPLNASSGCSD